MISALNVSSKCHVSFGNKHPELGRGIFCGGGGWAGEELGMGVSRLAFVVNAHVGF